MSDNQSIELILRVGLEDSYDAEIDSLTYVLKQEIQELGVSEVSVPSREMRQGEKSIDPTVIGTLIVGVGPILLTKFLEFLHAWAMRRQGRIIEITVPTAKGPISVKVSSDATMSLDEVKKLIGELSKQAQSNKNTNK